MKKIVNIFSVFLLFLGCNSFIAGDPETITYPKAATDNVVDDYHGTKVADPYRWLENPDSPETRAWIEAENKITFGFLEKIPEREKIKERLTKLWNYERYDIPIQENRHYFYKKNDGLQNQSVLYHAPALQGDSKVLIDPNLLSSDGTVALQDYAISRDAKHMAYGLSSAGSDWMEWKVRDVQSAKDLTDHFEMDKVLRRILEHRWQRLLLQPLQ